MITGHPLLAVTGYTLVWVRVLAGFGTHFYLYTGVVNILPSIVPSNVVGGSSVWAI